MSLRHGHDQAPELLRRRAIPAASAREPGAHGGTGQDAGGRRAAARRSPSPDYGDLPATTPHRVLSPGAEQRQERAMAPRMGLDLPERLPFEMWLRVGTQLAMAVSSSAWCLGDWLCFGQAAYTGRYQDAIERTSLDYQTLRNYAWVARRFPLSRRRDDLSFGHHAEAAALPEPEQDFWLRKAAEQGWSRNHLRREIRGSLRERQAGTAVRRPEEPDQSAGEIESRDAQQYDIWIAMTPSLLERCEQAAARQHLTVEAWAVRMLDQAAGHILGSDPTERHLLLA